MHAHKFLLGVASPVSEKISLWSIKVEKFNRSELVQKIHASRDRCHVHVHQFWWVWPLQFRRYTYLSKTAKFPFWGIDHGPCPMDHAPWTMGMGMVHGHGPWAWAWAWAWAWSMVHGHGPWSMGMVHGY